ncbi:hypothetical protein ANACAC_01186 [Anaerostipes caccae L1-92]|uniref:Uncharacterized protein n=1 Tax=Anaerostipes caccae (strain DSM 14662 / CCUG 47493 / JCM 13470 / NCIMB 13811 / L1-92) TaxID=411490 RepID=B0MC95_ANACD|nr:hypothetical protein ANACAC_01186 [Anaerostipes caccae L1-92]
MDVLKGDIPDTLLFVKIKGIYSVQAKAVCVRTMLKRIKKESSNTNTENGTML